MNAKSDFVVWGYDHSDDTVALEELVGVEDEWELNEGISRAEGWPSDARYPMDPECPDATVLTDSLYNTDRLLVVSANIREFLEALEVTKVEFLRVTVINHKKKPVKPKYYILNPVEPIDCLDAKQSGAELSDIDPGAVDEIKRLVIDETKVPADRSVFGIRGYGDAVLVRRGLAESMLKQRFTGVRFVELADFPEH